MGTQGLPAPAASEILPGEIDPLQGPQDSIMSDGATTAHRWSISSCNITRTSMIIVSLAFILLTYVIIKIGGMSPAGYVMDIYTTLPAALVPSLIVCFSLATILSFSRSTAVRYASTALLLIIFLAILVIPHAQGYYSMGRADDISYIGEYRHIASGGHIAAWDIYPAGPILGASTSLISGTGANEISFVIPIVFALLLVIGLNLFGRRFSSNRDYRSILLVSSFILYLGPYNFLNTPHALFFAFLPIYLYLMLELGRTRNPLILILILLLSYLLPISHPFILFFAVVLVISLLVLRPLVNRNANVDIRRLRGPVTIQVIGFVAWLVYNETMLENLRISVSHFLQKITDPVLSETASMFESANLSTPELTRFILIYYGRYIIPLLIGSVLICTYRKKIYNSPGLRRNMRTLFLLLSITLAVEGVLFLNPVIAHEADRMSNLLFLVYFQVPLFAFALMLFHQQSKPTKRCVFARHAFVMVIITLTFGLSLCGAFDSPHINRPNAALTYNEVEGMRWAYIHQEDGYVTSPLSQVERFHHLFDEGSVVDRVPIPDHFGYPTSSTLIKSIDGSPGPYYLITNTFDETLYEEIPAYRYMGRFVYGDFHQLLLDPGVDRVYSGRNMNVSFFHLPGAE